MSLNKQVRHRKSPNSSIDAVSTEQAFGSQSSGSLVDLINAQWQRERSDLDLSEFLLAIYCMRLGTLVERAYDRMCQREFGISGSDMRVLLALRRGGHPYVKRPTDLFRALFVTSGAITKKVDRLSHAGLVERMPDPSTNAGFLIYLTRKGLTVVDAATENLANQPILGSAMQVFNKAEREAGSQFILRTLSFLEAEYADDASKEVRFPDDAMSTPAKKRRTSKK